MRAEAGIFNSLNSRDRVLQRFRDHEEIVLGSIARCCLKRHYNAVHHLHPPCGEEEGWCHVPVAPHYPGAMQSLDIGRRLLQNEQVVFGQPFGVSQPDCSTMEALLAERGCPSEKKPVLEAILRLGVGRKPWPARYSDEAAATGSVGLGPLRL